MSTIYLSEFANPALKSYLSQQGHKISLISSQSQVYAPVASHPDIYMCKLNTDPASSVFYGCPEKLTEDYPGNIRYNAVCMGKYFIHNLAYTDKKLLDTAKQAGKTLLSVKQGYTKCNMVIVNENAAITSDQGIAKALRGTGIDLLVVSGGHVRLAGFPYGFLGGTSGKVGEELIFHGNLAKHPDFVTIKAFLRKHHCQFMYFEKFELEDIGSIIEAYL